MKQARLNSERFKIAQQRWHALNPTAVHPMTMFFEEIGAEYKRLVRDETYDIIVIIINDKKFTISCLKYGI